MEILGGLSALGGIFRGAASLVHELKAPRVSGEQFADILKAQLNAASSPETKSREADAWAAKFLDLHDADGNGALSLEESGFAAEVFGRHDTNGDGVLSAAELRHAHLNGAGLR